MKIYDDAKQHGEILFTDSNWHKVLYKEHCYSIATDEARKGGCLDSSFGDIDYLINRSQRWAFEDAIRRNDKKLIKIVAKRLKMLLSRFKGLDTAIKIFLTGSYAGNKHLAKELFALEGIDFNLHWNRFWNNVTNQSIKDFAHYLMRSKVIGPFLTEGDKTYVYFTSNKDDKDFINWLEEKGTSNLVVANSTEDEVSFQDCPFTTSYNNVNLVAANRY